MKLLWKLNCLLLILVIFVSIVYSSKYKSTDKSFEKLNSENEKNELDNFYHKEISKYDDIDKYLDRFDSQKSDSSKDLDSYNSLLEKTSNIQKGQNNVLSKKSPKKNPTNKNAKNQKKQILVKNTVPKAKLKIEKNTKIPVKKEDLLSNIKFSKCEKKSGFLYLVKNSKNLGISPLSINVIPIYVEMNMKVISFQMGPMQKTTFNQVNLENILKITKVFTNANCFEIIENEVINKSLAKTPVTLCAKELKEMIGWVNAIQQFKNCLYKISDKNSENKVLVDFEKINKLLKDNKTPDGKVPKELKKMFYQKSSPYIKSEKKNESEQIIKKQLNHIVETLETGNIQKNKMKRTMSSKLKNAENMAKDLRTKQSLINIILERRLSSEKEKEDEIKKQVHKQREVQLLKAVQQRIRQYKKSEMKQYQGLIDSRIKELKSKANNDAKGIMRSLLNQQKLSDYEECSDERLYLFKNTKYINDVCFNLFGEHNKDKCSEKSEFCGMCCEFHIGMRYSNKLTDCKTKCNNIIGGVKKNKKSK